MKSLSNLDLALVVGYLVAIAAFGSSFYRRRATPRDYFLGGRSMPWVAAGISIVAANLSAITVMGVPAWSYRYNFELFLLTFGPLLAAPIVIKVFVPFYSKLRLFTAYEYLEKRFNLAVRALASGQFQILRGCHVAIALYAPALVISQVTSLPTRECVVFIGIFTTLYTTLGGMKGVIWTDVIQFVTVACSLLLMIWVALTSSGSSLLSAFHLALATGHLKMVDLTFNPSSVTAFWPCIIGGATLSLSELATDQAALQRLFTTKSAEDCKQSIILQAFLVLPVGFVLYLMGTALFVFYHAHPAHMAGLRSEDDILPFFAIRELGPGLSGLVIAAIFAASMAVVSAGINSLTTATTVDIYHRILAPDASPERCTQIGRLGTILWGMTTTALALYANRLGEIAVAYIKVQGFIAGPMLGIFLLGILSGRSTSGGALIGAGFGTTAVTFISFSTHVSFLYDAPIGLVTTLISGYAASLFMKPSAPQLIEEYVLRRKPVEPVAPIMIRPDDGMKI